MPKNKKDDHAKTAEPTKVSNAEMAELKEKLLRAHADFQNYQRRAEQDRLQIGSVAKAAVLLEILPILDNFERAFTSAPADVKGSPWYEGIAVIKQQFEKTLADFGVERIESLGQPFDPNLHEAISKEPSDKYDEDIVSEEFEAGYKLGDPSVAERAGEVIRHAKVKVSSGKPSKKGDSQ